MKSLVTNSYLGICKFCSNVSTIRIEELYLCENHAKELQTELEHKYGITDKHTTPIIDKIMLDSTMPDNSIFIMGANKSAAIIVNIEGRVPNCNCDSFLILGRHDDWCPARQP